MILRECEDCGVKSVGEDNFQRSSCWRDGMGPMVFFMSAHDKHAHRISFMYVYIEGRALQ